MPDVAEGEDYRHSFGSQREGAQGVGEIGLLRIAGRGEYLREYQCGVGEGKENCRITCIIYKKIFLIPLFYFTFVGQRYLLICLNL